MRHFRVDRQRQGLGGKALRDREVAADVAEIGVGRLQVYRHRVVHAGGDAGLRKPLAGMVPPGQLDRVDVV